MQSTCRGCGAEIFDIDVKCPVCGRPNNSSGAYRMVGKRILGQYEIVDVLGQGGMSTVYKARHSMTDQEVALKILPPELAAHSQVKSRFVDEAKALAQLDHPNIVHLYNFGEENGSFVLAMQYVRGVTFERMILVAEELEWFAAARVAIDVLKALEYAHGRGVIHRDMKPSNILVRDHDGSATVMDFGIAKMTTSTRLTATGQTMGTVRYMSPEQVRGQPVDSRTDIYSLGATLYEAVCGDTPFDGDTHFEIMNKHLHDDPLPPSTEGIDMPAGFEQALMRCLAKQPEDRFTSARELRKELEGLLRDADIAFAETTRVSRDLVMRELRLQEQQGLSRSEMTDLVSAATESRPGVITGSQPLRVSDLSGPDLAAGRVTEAVPGGPGGVLGNDTIGGRAAPHGDGARRGRLATASPAAVESGRSRWLLRLALAAVFLAGAGAAGAVFLSDEGESAMSARKSERPSPPSPRADAVPEPFRPPGVGFAIERLFTEARLRVLAGEDWDPERIRDAVDRGHDRFVALVARGQPERSVERLPLTVAIVPKRVFCDARVYETGEVAQRCHEQEVLYRWRERTLLVADQAEHLNQNLAYGNAVAVCLHQQIPGCEDLVNELDESMGAGPP